MPMLATFWPTNSAGTLNGALSSFQRRLPEAVAGEPLEAST